MKHARRDRPWWLPSPALVLAMVLVGAALGTVWGLSEPQVEGPLLVLAVLVTVVPVGLLVGVVIDDALERRDNNEDREQDHG